MRKIIIDTDPGQDDALALMTAFGAKHEIQVLGITCVAGNVSLNLTSNNALKICELSGVFHVPVFKGSDAPLRRKLITAEHVHGKTGLDGTELSVERMKLELLGAVDFMIDSAEKYKDEKITICALGPLTNIAKVLIKNPKITESIEEIVLMGGGFFEGGNITPAAEFNIYVDPDAAKIVLESGVKITIFPLDVTHKTLVQRNFLEKLRNSGKNRCYTSRKVVGFF